MTHASIAPDLDPVMTARVIAHSLPRWRQARAEEVPVQPALFRSMTRYAMLAPVLDSLFRFYEAALGRKLGSGPQARDDEALLVSLLARPELSGSRLKCTRAIALAFDCALRSTRIMLALTRKVPGALPA